MASLSTPNTASWWSDDAPRPGPAVPGPGGGHRDEFGFVCEPVASWSAQEPAAGWSPEMLSWTQGAWQSPTVVLSGPRFGVHFAGVLLFSILLGLTWMLHIEANGPGGPVSRLLAVDESNLAATTGGDGDRVEVGVTGTAPVPAPAVPEAPGVVVVEPPPAPPALAVPGPVTGDVPSTGSGTYVAGGGGGGGASTVIEERTTVERGPPIAPGPGAVPGGRDVGVPTLANPDSNPTLGSGP